MQNIFQKAKKIKSIFENDFFACLNIAVTALPLILLTRISHILGLLCLLQCCVLFSVLLTLKLLNQLLIFLFNVFEFVVFLEEETSSSSWYNPIMSQRDKY